MEKVSNLLNFSFFPVEFQGIFYLNIRYEKVYEVGKWQKCKNGRILQAKIGLDDLDKKGDNFKKFNNF